MKKQEAIGVEEFADRRMKLPPSAHRSFIKWLQKMKRPPQGASVQVLKLWHDAKMNRSGNDAA